MGSASLLSARNVPEAGHLHHKDTVFLSAVNGMSTIMRLCSSAYVAMINKSMSFYTPPTELAGIFFDQ